MEGRHLRRGTAGASKPETRDFAGAAGFSVPARVIPTRAFPRRASHHRIDFGQPNGAARNGASQTAGDLLLTGEATGAEPDAQRPPDGGHDGILLLTDEVAAELHEPSPRSAADPTEDLPLLREELAGAGGPVPAGNPHSVEDILVLTDEIADDPMTPWWQTPEFAQFIRDHGAGDYGEAAEADRIAMAQISQRAPAIRNATRDPRADEPAAPPPVPQSGEMDTPLGNGDTIMETEHTDATASPHPTGNGAGIERAQVTHANPAPMPPETTAQPANKTAGLGQAAGILGAVAWLMARSAEHRHLFLADLEWRVLPAIALGQCRLVQKDGQPVAFVSWANVSEQVAQRLTSGERRLKPEEWKSGNRRLMVDVVAPFGGAESVMKAVQENAPVMAETR